MCVCVSERMREREIHVDVCVCVSECVSTIMLRLLRVWTLDLLTVCTLISCFHVYKRENMSERVYMFI